jgi:oligoendopeptidase F
MAATGPPRQTQPHRRYVPSNLDIADVATLETLYRSLLFRPVDSLEQLQRWLADFSELDAIVNEYGSRRYIDKSCHTEDENIKKRYLQFVEEIEPRIKPLVYQLQRKYLQTPNHDHLGPQYEMMRLRWQSDVEVFRNENVEIETEITKRLTEFDQLNGQMMVRFRGEDLTMQQMARFQEEPDRMTRREAWEQSVRRRLIDRDAIETIYESLLPLRHQIALNAGLEDFRQFQWKANKRFDYTPADCLKFADAIAETCVPVVHRLDKQRSLDLGLEKLRPWDIAVDLRGRPPLRPFDPNDINTFLDKTREIFKHISPVLMFEFDRLRAWGNLDLQSRKGKQPGGYLMPLEESRQPFIFMNAAGLQRDVETLLHESGHAFHHLAASAAEDIVFLRSAPMEFCEVASMSMELLGSEHLDVFYEPRDLARARRNQIEGVIRFLPWMAIIDSFQHWIYTHPKHAREERRAFWLGLLDRFASKLDWSGWETARESLWQRQTHLFHSPFYYIEYGIAQLGALQLWAQARKNSHAAVEKYRNALALGGTKSLPELFAAAGIKFDFSEKTLRPIIAALEEELQRLPR